MIQRAILVVCCVSMAMHVGQFYSRSRVPQPCRPPLVREVPPGRFVF